jgi:hypothetical protein
LPGQWKKLAKSFTALQVYIGNYERLARNYLEKENRSNEIKEYTLEHMASKNKKLRKKNPTPIDIMYQNR